MFMIFPALTAESFHKIVFVLFFSTFLRLSNTTNHSHTSPASITEITVELSDTAAG
jgi:hypothetical protein